MYEGPCGHVTCVLLVVRGSILCLLLVRGSMWSCDLCLTGKYEGPCGHVTCVLLLERGSMWSCDLCLAGGSTRVHVVL